MPALLTRVRLLASALAIAGAALPARAGPIDSRIYPAPSVPLTLAGLPRGSRFVEARTSDGLRLRGIAAPGRSDRPLLLVLHGNGSSATTALQWLGPIITSDGFGIVAAEYRGYSGHPGKPSEAALVRDASAFLALARQEAAGQPVWVVGHSLGGGVALALARSEKLDSLITIGAFTRLRDMAPAIARRLMPNEYRNVEAVAALDEPLYVVHGLRDTVVPWKQGEALHTAAGRAGRNGASFILPAAGHQPSASDIGAILRTIYAQRASGAWDPARLPNGALLIPFGSSTPLKR